MTALPLDATVATPQAAAQVSRQRRLLAVLVLAATMAVFLGSGRLLADPDTQWHVAAGRWMWANGGLPRVDAFSHTFAGQPWIAKEWLAQLLLAGAHAALGWAGPALLAALAVGVALAVQFVHADRALGPLRALGLTFLALLLLQSQILARPHILVIPLAVVWIAGLAHAVETGRRPPLALAGLVLVWTNLHGTAPLALLALGAFGFDAVLAADAGRRRSLFVGWLGFAVLATLAWLTTPYGLEPLRIFMSFSAGANAWVPFIDEWRPVRFNASGVAAALTLAGALFALAREPRRHLGRIALCLVMGCLAARHGRFLGLAGFFVIGAALGPLAALIGSERLVLGNRTVRLLECAAVAAVLFAASMPVLKPQAPLGNVAPERALAAAEHAGIAGSPVFNSYNFGGFLVERGVPSFVDGRTDQLFLGDFLSELQSSVGEKAPNRFLDFVERHGARWALVETRGGEAAHFRAAAPRWRLIYRDEDASVFAYGAPR